MEIVEEVHKSDKDIASPAEIFEIGEEVKIKEITNEPKRKIEPEDYFYLKGFENKTGVISEQKQSNSGTYTYRVEFNQHHFGYFYGKDLERR